MDDRQQESTNEGGSGGEATLPIPPPPAGSTQGPPSASQAGEKGAAETPRIRSTSGASEGSIDVSATPETGGGGGGAAGASHVHATNHATINRYDTYRLTHSVAYG